MKRYPIFTPVNLTDCGPVCLKMIAKYYNLEFSLDELRNYIGVSDIGSSFLGIAEAAELIGFKTLAMEVSMEDLVKARVTPFVCHWNKSHFIVVYKFSKKTVVVGDPGIGIRKLTWEEYIEGWTQNENNQLGFVLLFQLGLKTNKIDRNIKSITFNKFLAQIFKYKFLLINLSIGLLLSSIIQFTMPFLTQQIVDVGIKGKNLHFIYLILASQLALFIGQSSIEFIRNWLILHINIKVNLAVFSDFLIKLMKLPLSYFESRIVGDIFQRVGDQQRIQSFLSTAALNIIFSISNLIIFGVVIFLYNRIIFYLFSLGSIVYIIWVLFFMNRRKKLDQSKFKLTSTSYNKMVEAIYGMQEIKMHNCETSKRWELERIQAELYKNNIDSLSLNQFQHGGGVFISQVKNMLITIISATSVVHGDITIGEMIAIQYIVGLLNGPLEQIIAFIQSRQDALISIRRLNETYSLKNEDSELKDYKIELNKHEIYDIDLMNVNFAYPNSSQKLVLSNITLKIPKDKTTAIVGMSGSGKTTLLKVLLKTYQPQSGSIYIGPLNINDINNKAWRKQCGTVFQDNYIFSDTILNNIAIGDEYPDISRANYAVKIANILEFIESLELGWHTIIGSAGNILSNGQRQRIVLARAIYKNPNYYFLDEATNSLDSKNEKVILENLASTLERKTVIIVAHRLSTIRNAYQIVVLKDGKIVECGNHDKLISLRSTYYELVADQLAKEDEGVL